MESRAVHPDDARALSAEERADRAVKAVDDLAAGASRVAMDMFWYIQFLFFLLYLLMAVVGFWLGFFAAVLGTIRMAVRFVKSAMLYLSGGHPPPPGGRAHEAMDVLRQEVRRLWHARVLAYADVTRPIARHYVSSRVAVRRFWHWGVARKFSTMLVIPLFVLLPLAYVIPRPHEIMITDDNALSHTDGDQLRYLIHAIDLNDPTVFREYENEFAWYLGKFDTQGLKSKLQPGHFYRVWVVGIRWYYFPRTAFPNLLWATEIDRAGNEMTGEALIRRHTGSVE
jgi:hypothetical protein